MAGPGLIWADDVDDQDDFDEDDDGDDAHLINMFGDQDSSDDDDELNNIMGLDMNPVCVIQ